MNKKEILAIHKKKLEEFLKKLELWDPFINNEIKCAICEKTISYDNIGFIIPSQDRIVMCCSDVECIFRLKSLQGEKVNEN